MAFTGTVWLAGDLHFEHPGIVKERDGIRARPFETVEEHDEAVINNWNSTVGPKDKVYVMGDVCMKKAGLQKVARLNGIKHLIKGNHDIFEMHDYDKLFYNVSAYRVLQDGDDRMLLSHMPVHTMELERFQFNVHGHLHSRKVMRYSQVLDKDVPDLRYFNVSLEAIDYTPIRLETVKKIRIDRGL